VRVLLSGYYGFDNLGDDALLQIIVSQLKTRYPHVTIDALSAKPEITAHELGISTRTVEVHRASLMHKLKVRSLSDLLRLSFAAGMGAAEPV